MTFQQDTDETPVIFRKYGPRRGGEVIALFPAEPWADAYNCACYVHVGQHGEADPRECIRVTRLATPGEYASLKTELEGAPYGYRFKVYAREQRRFRELRQQAMRRVK